MGVKLAGDWSRVTRRLERLVKLDFGKVHDEIGEYLVSETHERFKKGVGPDGKAWPPSRRASAEGGQTLVDSKVLQNSMTFKASAGRVEVGTNDKRAAVHQNGATIKAKRAKFLKFKVGDQWVAKKQVKIPARPFLGISDHDQVEIARIIGDAIEEAIK